MMVLPGAKTVIFAFRVESSGGLESPAFHHHFVNPFNSFTRLFQRYMRLQLVKPSSAGRHIISSQTLRIWHNLFLKDTVCLEPGKIIGKIEGIRAMFVEDEVDIQRDTKHFLKNIGGLLQVSLSAPAPLISQIFR